MRKKRAECNKNDRERERRKQREREEIKKNREEREETEKRQRRERIQYVVDWKESEERQLFSICRLWKEFLAYLSNHSTPIKTITIPSQILTQQQQQQEDNTPYTHTTHYLIYAHLTIRDKVSVLDYDLVLEL